MNRKRIFIVLLIVLLFMAERGHHEGSFRERGISMDDKTLIPIYSAKEDKVSLVSPIEKTDKEWKRLLPSEIYKIARGKGTERPFTCSAEAFTGQGVFKCAACGTDLFFAAEKFDSGTGWPSFMEPVSENNIKYQDDLSHGMSRTEVLCARCGAHLGHVFDDGPPPTGKRYCINSVVLEFVPMKSVE